MRTSHQLYVSLCLISAMALTGCATVVSGRDAKVTVTSNPPDAHVAIRNQEGRVVATGVTPMHVSLDRSRGLLKKPPRYTAILQKPGFKPQKIAIKPTVNPWVAGNLLVGPLGVVADSATGAMWNLKPNKINRQLTPMQGNSYGQSRAEAVSQASYASDMPRK